MNPDDIIKYCDRMEDIKRRIAVLRHLLTFPEPLTQEVCIESAYLQFRKILEQIAFGSLASNREKFGQQYKRFSKYWNAADLFRDLHLVNKHFYPEPVDVHLNPSPDVKVHFIGKKSGYLTKGEFLELYGKSGDILYERNPYARPADSEWFLNNAHKGLEKIVGLLDVHTIHLYGDPDVYVVRMGAPPDDRVEFYTMKLKDGR